MVAVKVGLLTTWNTQCGIAEYSRALVEAFQRRPEIELTVLGSRNYDERSIAEHEDYVLACFDVESWNRYGHNELDVEAILALDLDVLHIQYEALLYNQERLNELLRRFEGVTIATWHDQVIPEGLEWQRVDAAFTHREGVGPGEARVIPLAIRSLPAVVRTFGMGRTREDVIRPICERNGWLFESLASSEAPLGGQPWRPWRELHDWLRGADAVVLWYDDDPAAGSSAAARTAIATRRPVIVNDTSWFRELPQQSGSFYKLKDDLAELESTLREVLRGDTLIERWSTDAVVDRYIDGYDAALARRALEPEPAPSPPGRLRGWLLKLRRKLAALSPLRRLRRKTSGEPPAPG
jgi:hypothetical protein